VIQTGCRNRSMLLLVQFSSTFPPLSFLAGEVLTL
jgi:hypothetical protein